MAKRVAVVLAGCGVFDGSEIHEASAVLVHLSREGAQAEVYAPNIPQMHVVDHVKGQPTAEQRNVLVESARIARGNIKDLATLDVKGLDALIIPGRTVWGLPQGPAPRPFAMNPKFQTWLQRSLLSINPDPATPDAPTPTPGFPSLFPCRWPYAKTAEAMKELGCRHINSQVTEAHVDARNLLVSTSAFMCNAPIHQVHDGIGSMVREVLRLA
ncbi:GAL3A protein, partial [Agelaius phoeniceus]|nr:GAL3A protein [Agelaius phoeniceus]